MARLVAGWLYFLCLCLTAGARRGGGMYRTAYACEGTQLSFSCADGQLISLIRANYGRFSISICNEHGTLDWSVDCKSNRSYAVIQESCGMRSRCVLPASTTLFGDPCPGTFKYLEAHYKCIAESPTTTASTTPLTTTTSSTTSRPLIIIPATQYQKPILATSPAPPPRTSTASSTTSSTTSTTASRFTQVTSSTTTTASTTTTSTSSSSPPSTSTASSVTRAPTTSERPSTVADSQLGKGRYLDDPSGPSLVQPHIPQQQDLFCAPVQTRNMLWNWTRAGDTAYQKCPSDAIGRARWTCLDTSVPTWDSDTPDLSSCYSVWMDNLKGRAGDGDSVVSLAVELEVMTRTKSLLGGDMLQTTALMENLLATMARRMDDLPDDKVRYQVVKELLQSVVEVSSNLLEDYQKESWRELPPGQRRRVAGSLLGALDNATWLLASTKNSAFRFSRAHGNVLVSVRLVETWSSSEIRFPAHEDVHGTVWIRMEDSLVFPPQALLASARNGLVKMVFLAYRNIEDFLGPERMANEPERIINSRVLSASVNSQHNLKLHQPVVITFQHRHVDNVTNPRCVYWNLAANDWLTDGCWLRETNVSHSVCVCNHLTSFALSMDRSPPDLTMQRLQTFVYASFAVCMFLLLVTSLTLLAFRTMKGDRVSIHKNVCLCLLVSEALLASGLSGVAQRVVCGILAGFLHYFWLAAFFWILLEGFQLYTILLDVLGTTASRLRWYYLTAYASPAVVVCVGAGINPAGYGLARGCWLDMNSYQLLSFVGPAAFCVLLCLVFVALVFCKAHRHTDAALKSKEHERITIARCLSMDTTLLLLSLSLTTAFAQLYLLEPSATYTCVFASLNILLGCFVFVFYCLRNEKVQRVLEERVPLGCLRVGGTSAGTSQPPSLFVHANGLPYSCGAQQSWSSQKEPQSSEVDNCATPQGLPSIATVNYPGEEHPMRSWAWANDGAPPYGHWATVDCWRPPDPRVDHVYETIDDDPSDAWRSLHHQLRTAQRPPAHSYHSLGRPDCSVQKRIPNDRATILGSLSAVLTNSPRTRPLIGDASSCLRPQVAYCDIKTDSSTSSLMEGDEDRQTSACWTKGYREAQTERPCEGVEHF
ncbi:adhesion G protein-coupled receptor L1-like isoform X2 [Ornithodoros turicata]|uniref:adhesion G protein-coupled receptor L1-like isoform X2 n=1 Tax=Ornithodoros turicata TaxID=34597 RepID=UPI003139434F